MTALSRASMAAFSACSDSTIRRSTSRSAAGWGPSTTSAPAPRMPARQALAPSGRWARRDRGEAKWPLGSWPCGACPEAEARTACCGSEAAAFGTECALHDRLAALGESPALAAASAEVGGGSEAVSSAASGCRGCSSPGAVFGVLPLRISSATTRVCGPSEWLLNTPGCAGASGLGPDRRSLPAPQRNWPLSRAALGCEGSVATLVPGREAEAAPEAPGWDSLSGGCLRARGCPSDRPADFLRGLFSAGAFCGPAAKRNLSGVGDGGGEVCGGVLRAGTELDSRGSGRIRAGLLTVEVRLAYSNVLLESSKWSRPGWTFAIMETSPSLTSELFSSSVSLESRYGGLRCGVLSRTPEPSFRWRSLRVRSPRALMQLASASSDWLIFAPSRRAAPVFCVCEARSEPARSMRQILECKRRSSASAALLPSADLRSKRSSKTACEREERRLAAVLSTFRSCSPACSCIKASSAVPTGTERKFAILTRPRRSSSIMLHGVPPVTPLASWAWRRSKSFSLYSSRNETLTSKGYMARPGWDEKADELASPRRSTLSKMSRTAR
mmetsp:Transcript_18873/g.59239  ORF Transcript_18873/g.59239 Transcript_18873/m.59239 type:complete len:557 (+) Transcript_18873:191-1861(+)